jgi:hypothetical protein
VVSRAASRRSGYPGGALGRAVYAHGEHVFWDVQEPDRAIAIRLRDNRLDKLVIEVENPEQEIARIRQAIAGVATLARPV